MMWKVSARFWAVKKKAIRETKKFFVTKIRHFKVFLQRSFFENNKEDHPDLLRCILELYTKSPGNSHLSEAGWP